MFIKITAIALIVFGLFFAVFGVYFLILGVSAEGWTPVEGEVTSVKVRTDVSVGTVNPQTRMSTASENRYYAEVGYAWTVDGQRYTGDRYRLGETQEKFLDREDAVAAALKYKNGMPITVYYQADHPSQAVLNPSLSVGAFVPLPMGLLLLTCGWGLIRAAPAIEKALAAGH
ncbi:MAG: DUF3592 domain-containing protein [Acidobacteriota bacterium]